ncbi:MAG: MBL fold metallo-hydrolase [Alphaproteobacteria bacterium]|nr:MBL fold metallo-hydrolase [Alphaproteobacteria bacterium]
MLSLRFWLGLGVGIALCALVVLGTLSFFGSLIGPMLIAAPAIPVPPVIAPAEATKMSMQEARDLVANDDRKDFEFAERGFIATRSDPIIRRADGGVVVDLSSYDFLQGQAPESVNPSLWRHAQILTKHGLFKVMDGIYQVRGFDISTVTFIDAGEGWIVVDPLTTMEAAKAAYDLVSEHLGQRAILAVIYSHSHGDHFGGAAGIISAEDARTVRVKVIAPDGFLKEAVSENIIAGPAMSRRARYQFGMTLPRGPEGEVTSGLGPGVSRGTISMIAPTIDITTTGQELTIGTVTLVFQVTPGTEAPAEMNFYLPQFRAVFMAENANLTMHNLLPARGALVRDSKAWADYLTESIRLFGDKSEVMFAAHGIPRFGQAEIVAFLKKHRDAYKFLHDQSVRLMNGGLTAAEIAEVLALPSVLAREWYNRGYYGTMSHNSKAIYQRYMGWFDANPANLWPLPPEPAAKLYVEAMGGAEAVMARAREAAAAGDYRWAAMLLNHLVFADAGNEAARSFLAEVYTQLGFQAEAGTWRNIYLTGAQELRSGVLRLPPATVSAEMLDATTTAMLLDFAAVRVNPEKALAQSFALNIEITDRGERVLVTVENGVLIHEEGVSDKAAGASVQITRGDLVKCLFGGSAVAAVIKASGGVTITGDAALFDALVSLIEPVDANFNIVTP